jgi:SAM-dependent methyltransferase
MKNKEKIRNKIRQNYSEVAQKGSSGGCCGGGCSCDGSSVDVYGSSLKIGYTPEDVLNAPKDSNMGLGCGNPIAIANLNKGEVVLDLGSGGGFDSFLASKKVGDDGLVIGVDMTPEMISLARKNAEEDCYTNVEFRLGEIEHLPVADESVDVIISNCVINLSQNKEQVFKDAYRVLKVGGRLSISDVVATAELPDEIKNDLFMMTGCITGAEFVDNIQKMMENAGFMDVKLTPKDNGREIVKSWVPERNIEDYVCSYIIEGRK